MSDPVRAATLAAAAWLTERERAGVELLGELVALDTPSDEPELLAAGARGLAALLGELGEVVELPCDGAPHLVANLGPPAGGPLLLCHYDTVWPAGTAARWPFAVRNGWASGPGVLDMKGGIVVAIQALRALAGCGLVPANGVRLSLTPDEERGNPASRDAIERLARASCAALVLEPPLHDGRLKTRRKGIAHAIVEVDGEAAHAGVVQNGGVSAALEVARIALAAAELADAERGVSINVGVLAAGDRRNVVAASGVVELDVRAHDPAELDAVLDRLRELVPANPRATIRVRGAVHRPPMEPSAATGVLMAIARDAGTALDLRLDHGSSGGASEANLAHAVGTPTLDGLGACGHGAHAEDERILVSSLTERAAVLVGVIVGAAERFANGGLSRGTVPYARPRVPSDGDARLA